MLTAHTQRTLLHYIAICDALMVAIMLLNVLVMAGKWPEEETFISVTFPTKLGAPHE